MHYILWLILSSIFFACGEFLSKKFANAPSVTYVLLIIASYIMGTLAWLPAILQKNQLSIVGAIWSVMSLAMTVIIGMAIFDERLGKLGTIGLVLAAISILLLSIDK